MHQLLFHKLWNQGDISLQVDHKPARVQKEISSILLQDDMLKKLNRIWPKRNNQVIILASTGTEIPSISTHGTFTGTQFSEEKRVGHTLALYLLSKESKPTMTPTMTLQASFFASLHIIHVEKTKLEP